MTSFLESITSAEISILDFLTTHLSNPFFDTVMPFLSAICNHGEIWIALALVLLVSAKTRRAGMSMAFALIFGLVVGNMILKPAVARIRPYDISGYELIVPKMDDFSFPSGHTLASFEAAGALMMTYRKIGTAALVLAFLIAFSRIYLYVHYPSDVIASIILGVLFAYLAVKLTDKIIGKHPAVVSEKHK